MKIIVVTGKSGAGKTYVSNILNNLLDGTHLSLDKISHKTLTLSNVKNFILDTFGRDVFDGEEINRKKLGKMSFSQPNNLEKLNQLCEKEMEKLIDETIANNEKKYIILDYMLLPLMKYFDMADFKILVTADNQIRKERIILRDGITEDYFHLRDKHSLEFEPNNYDFVTTSDDLTKIEEIANTIKSKLD